MPTVSPSGGPVVLHGAAQVARGAHTAASRAGMLRLALVNGEVGIVFDARRAICRSC